MAVIDENGVETIVDAPVIESTENIEPTESAKVDNQEVPVESVEKSGIDLIRDLHSRAENGENLSPEELEKYLDWVNDGGDPEELLKESAEVEKKELTEEDEKEKKPEAQPEGNEIVGQLEKLIGAKTLEDVPVKIKSLLANQQKLSEGKKAVERSLEETTAGFKALVADIIAGKPEAIEYARENGIDINAAKSTAKNNTSEPSDLDAAIQLLENGEFVDEELSKSVKTIINGLKNQVLSLQSKVDEAVGFKNQVAESATKANLMHKVERDLIGLNSAHNLFEGDVVKAFRDWNNNPDKDFPEFEGLADVILHSAKTGLAFEDSFKILNFDKIKEGSSAAVIKAKRETAESLLKQPETRGLSKAQESQNVQQYTESDIKLMASGQKEIPSEWIGEDGILLVEKIPVGLRKAAGF